MRSVTDRVPGTTLAAADAAALRSLFDTASALQLVDEASDDDVRATAGQIGTVAASVLALLRTYVAQEREDASPDPLADLCFGGVLELSRGLRELLPLQPSTELWIRIESVRRKVCRTIHNVLAVADPSAIDATYPLETLATAIALRRAYAAFRRNLVAVDRAATMLDAVRYAGGAIAQLVANPAYAHARKMDRAVLSGLRDRLFQWVRQDRAPWSGQRIIGDIKVTAQLLRDINRRQELRLHDQALVAQIAQMSDVMVICASLRSLEGLDDEVDRVLVDSTELAATDLRGLIELRLLPLL